LNRGSVTGTPPKGEDGFLPLRSSCVVIEERLDPEIQAGIYPSKVKGKGDYSGDLRKVPCTQEEEHIGAEQIFKRLTHPWYCTPTIKHHCPRTALAASLRACSNKVGYDPVMMEDYAKWFRSKYIPRFLKCLDKTEINVNLEQWLKKDGFSNQYRDKMRKARWRKIALLIVSTNLAMRLL